MGFDLTCHGDKEALYNHKFTTILIVRGVLSLEYFLGGNYKTKAGMKSGGKKKKFLFPSCSLFLITSFQLLHQIYQLQYLN